MDFQKKDFKLGKDNPPDLKPLLDAAQAYELGGDGAGDSKKGGKKAKGGKKGEKKKDNRIVEKSVDVNEGPKKRPREERERFDAKKSKSRERQSFIPSKTYARMPGYVFKVGPRGLGHYLDVQMTVNQAALYAILRMGKGKSNSRRKTRR